MIQFFSSSYYCWVVSRIILIVLSVVSLLQIFLNERLRTAELIANLAFFVYVILLIIASIKELSGFKKRSLLNVITGYISFLIGLTLMTLVVAFSYKIKVAIPLAALFCVWLLLLGLFDICKEKNNP